MQKTIGLVLVVLGIVMVIYTGFNFVTKEKVVDIGPIQIDRERNHFVDWSPFAGVTLLISGIIVIMFIKKTQP